MRFRNSNPVFDCYRVTDQNGNFLIQPKYAIADDKLLQIYKCMTSLDVMDDKLYEAQRQGKLSFYMTSTGEEATVVGAAAALNADDEIFSQYRECGALTWRGFTYQQITNQCVGTDLDLGKGRQMPIHYGCRELHFQTVSSPLATQLPHAAGAAYALKRDNSDRVVACFFGEGAASEGDFHAALNFAATLGCPVLFICRNNGYAISTPTREQLAGDGVAARGVGYGIRTTRVDGLDVHAVFDAVSEGRKLCKEHNAPVLIECMSYRGGPHSTSDDPFKYRTRDEVKYWQERNPIARLRQQLERKGLWTQQQDAEFRVAKKQEILHALSESERRRKPSIDQMFVDVYSDMPPMLQEQFAEVKAHVQEHAKEYNIEEFA